MKKPIAAVVLLCAAFQARAGTILDEIAKKLKEAQKKSEQQQQPAKPGRQPPNQAPPGAARPGPAGRAGTGLGPARQFSGAELTANGMDIMGVKLGMSTDEVLGVLREKNVSVTQTRTVFQYPHALGDAAAGNKSATDPYEHPAVKFTAGNANARPLDTITIEFTPEATPRVYRVTRAVALEPGNLLYAPWEKAVFEKYGQPMSGGPRKQSHGFAGGDFMWAKDPPVPNCGSTSGSIQLPNGEQAAKQHADRVEECGPWALWIRANGPEPYITGYQLSLTGYGLMDGVTRTMWAKVQEHVQAREAANQEHARALSEKKPDL